MTSLGRALRSGVRRLAARRHASAPPVISVIVPVYDVEEYLAEAVASLAAQTYPYLEVVLVDDGSTDGSLDLARRLTHDDPRFTVVPAKHGGLGATRNKGLALATGKYVTFMDSDDVVPPDAYASMVASLERTGSGMVLGNVERFDSTRAWIPGWARAVHAVDVDGATLATVPGAMRDILACNRMYRRSFWDARVGTFPEGVVFEDHAPMLRSMLAGARFDILARVTYRWRRRDDRSSLSQPKEELANLVHRVRAKEAAWEILAAEGTDAERALWLARVLDLDFSPYLGHGSTASIDYQEMLATTVTTYLDLASQLTARGHDIAGGIRGHRRLAAWYASHRDWAALGSLTTDLHERRPPRARPTADGWMLDDDARAQRAPLLPAWLRELPDSAVAATLTVVRITWTAAGFVVRGTLTIHGADVAPHDVVLRGSLAGYDADVSVVGRSPRRAGAPLTGTELDLLLSLDEDSLAVALPADGEARFSIAATIGGRPLDVIVEPGTGTRAPRPFADVRGRAVLQPSVTSDGGLTMSRRTASHVVEDVCADGDAFVLRLDPAPGSDGSVVLGSPGDGHVLERSGDVWRLPVEVLAAVRADAVIAVVTAGVPARVSVPSRLRARMPRGLAVSARAGLHAVPGTRMALTRLGTTDSLLHLTFEPVGLTDVPEGVEWRAVLRDGDRVMDLPATGAPPRYVTFDVPRRAPEVDSTMAPSVASCRLTLTMPDGAHVPLVVAPDVLDAQPATAPSGTYNVRVIARDGGIEMRVEHLEFPSGGLSSV